MRNINSRMHPRLRREQSATPNLQERRVMPLYHINRINGTTIADVEADTFGSALSIAVKQGTNLTDVNLADVNLAGVNLTRANLTGVNLTRANLTGVNL